MRTIIICLLLFCHYYSFGQTNISIEDNTPIAKAQKYALQTIASPESAGSTNYSSASNIEAGQQVWLNAYNNTGFKFVKWMCADSLVSEASGFYFTMPANDVVLTAIFEYNPENPPQPDSLGLSHTLTVVALPEKSGSFNVNKTLRMVEGESVNLYAYPNTGFTFEGWDLGDTIIRSEEYRFTMGEKDMDVIARFTYNPENPSDPGSNYWNETTGEVIVDDFAPGRLSTAIYNAIGNSNNSDVTMITVAGQMNSSDFGIANNYDNCTLLDLSRVTGITEVPSYAFDYTNLESVYLPATIEKIGYRAFADCQNLSSLTCYAMTPPVLEDYVFENVPEGLVVYVPAAVIAQYQDSETWKDFTLLPIQDDVRSLIVNLPTGTNVEDYKQMWIELLNTKSGQKLHYVMTDRQSYTFPNLIRNTTWNVTIRNEEGDIFGKIENVEVKDEDITVNFSSLLKPQTVQVKVLTPDNEDVTPVVKITWTGADGKYLGYNTSLNGLIEGKIINWEMVLPQNLAMKYVVPAKAEFTVKSSDNIIECKLEDIPSVVITGKVIDMASGQPLKNAVISASQTFAEKYSKTINDKTDAKGLYKLEIFDVPTVMSFSASDYISQNINCDSLIGGKDSVYFEDTKLKAISGAVLTVGFTYTSSVAENETPEFQDWYNDYNNVQYAIYNKTKDWQVSQFNVQYPQIVLLEEVDENDELQITATSINSSFMPVVSTATINEQKADVAFDIYELGQVSSSFKTTTNASVVGILYDDKGKYIKSYNYSNASLTIGNLADGNYILVAMGDSQMLNTIYDLSQYEQSGLVAEKDYVLQTVEVKSGVVSHVVFESVPKLDESKFFYTSSGTSFSVNKSNIVAGNYLTLMGKIDFKPEYTSAVSNIQMIVDIPESCQFVENSVMVGNSTSSYVINDNRLTIPMARYTDRVRFCVLPTKGGDYAPSAFVQFDLKDKTINQPIGSAHYTAKDLSISVPKTVAKTTVPVNGTAIGQSKIEIFDNGTKIGETISLANGVWSTTCELDEPYNLSTHEIYAKVTTMQGLVLQSETKECRYDKDAIEVKTVNMSFYNAWLRKNVNVLFDYNNPQTGENSYMFYTTTDFTFVVDFTNNSPELVSNVVLYVYTDNNNVIPLIPEYNKEQDRWIAVKQFSWGNLPVNVDVVFLQNKINTTDNNVHFENQINEMEDWHNSIYDYAQDHLNFEVLTDEDMSCSYRITGEDLEQEQIWTITQLEYNKAKQMLREYSFEHIKSEGGNGYSCRRIVKENDSIILYLIDTEENIAFELRLPFTQEIPETQKAMNISKLYKNTLRKLKKELTNPKAMFGHGLNFWDNALDVIGIKKYVGAKDFNLCFDVMDDYMDKLIAQKDLTAKLITKQCIDGSYSLNEEQRKKFAEDLMNTDVLLGQYLNTFESYVELYQWKLASSVWVDFLTMGAGKVLSGTAKAGKILTNSKNAKYFKYIIKDKHVRNWTESSIGIAFSYATDGLSKVIDPEFTKFEEVESDMYQWMKERFDSYNKIYDNMQNRISNSSKKCKEKPDSIPELPTPSLKPRIPIHDPSGYVYEAVSSNRLEGVTASCYYKETVEDMYGDLHDNVVLWNAEEYAQKNPLFTDEDGMYRWDVPQGLWQVKFEKEGYETTYSDWLPVPPPQLEVNIPMKQNVQPNVKSARAFENAVEVQFDKYMMPEMLTTENIMVLADENIVEGTIELLDEEVSYEGETDKYASKIRFNAKEPFSAEEVTLIVKNRVKSYAGIRMQDDYSQNFTVELEVRKIECDSVLSVVYGEQSTITVQALPASAAAGKILKVKSLAPLLLSVDKNAVALDAEGKAEITISGDLPGTAALSFEVDGYDISAISVVKIGKMESLMVATPTTSIASGSEVAVGTEIFLSCATGNATIYYTLDGTCPCENTSSVIRYDGTPIVINETTTIKAIAYAEGMYESEVATFVYTVNNGSGIDEEKTGKYTVYPQLVKDIVNIDIPDDVSANVCIASVHGQTVYERKNMTGHNTVDMTGLTKGMYVVAIRDGNELVSIKIIKIGN